jgi:hypothetical protein
MIYYNICESLNSKIVGLYSQVEKALYSCDVWEETKFIDRVGFVKLDFEPITAKAILMKKSKLTDLISAGIIGFSLKLLISGKLKSILEKNRNLGIQFYKSPVIYKEKEIDDFWVVNPYQFDFEFIDFHRSKVFLMKNVFEKQEELLIKSSKEFLDQKNRIEQMGYPYSIYIEKFKLIDNLDEDFFVLQNVERGIKYIVSEKLKKEIEEAGCTGIEFQPIEFSMNEWLQGGEREKVYGKI